MFVKNSNFLYGVNGYNRCDCWIVITSSSEPPPFCNHMHCKIHRGCTYTKMVTTSPYIINLLGVGVAVIKKAALPGRGLAIALKLGLTSALALIG